MTKKKKDKSVSNLAFDDLIFSTSKIHLGTVPEEILYDTIHYIGNLRKINPEIEKLEKYCGRGNKKFIETRAPVERESVRLSKSVGLIKNHFLFYDKDEQFKEVVSGIANFKPVASVFEIKHLPKLENCVQIQGSIERLRMIKHTTMGKRIKEEEEKMKAKVEKEEEGFKIEMPDDQTQNERAETREDMVKQYRDPKFFISHYENKEKVDDFMKKNHISVGEVDNIFMADENQDFFKLQKHVWDSKKNKFKKILMNQKGENIEENGIKLKAMKEKMKKQRQR